MKIIKRKYLGFAFISNLVFISVFLTPIIELASFNMNFLGPNIKTSADGVSNYTVTQGVTYDVQVNLSVTTGGPTRIYFKHPRFDDLQPGSITSPYSGPFQVSELLYSNVIGSDDPSALVWDDYGNSFDLFNITAFGSGDTLSFDQHYNINLNEVSYGDLSSLPITMSDYNTSDDMFLYFCNQSDPDVYQTDNSALIAKSNELASFYTNPFDKAVAIINYVATHLEYTQLSGDEKGAYWAYINGKGDCSEYSSLMITLLRIQGIPARKAGGFMIVQDMGYKPYVGQTWTFDFEELIAHAWVEYYIPSIGWIQCEPQVPSTIKTSSYLRMTQTLGAWFQFPYWSGGIQYYNLSEYNLLCVYNAGDVIDYSITITVLDTNLFPDINWFILIIIISIIGVIVVISILGIRSVINKRKNRSDW